MQISNALNVNEEILDGNADVSYPDADPHVI